MFAGAPHAPARPLGAFRRPRTCNGNAAAGSVAVPRRPGAVLFHPFDLQCRCQVRASSWALDGSICAVPCCRRHNPAQLSRRSANHSYRKWRGGAMHRPRQVRPIPNRPVQQFCSILAVWCQMPTSLASLSCFVIVQTILSAGRLLLLAGPFARIVPVMSSHIIVSSIAAWSRWGSTSSSLGCTPGCVFGCMPSSRCEPSSADRLCEPPPDAARPPERLPSPSAWHRRSSAAEAAGSLHSTDEPAVLTHSACRLKQHFQEQACRAVSPCGDGAAPRCGLLVLVPVVLGVERLNSVYTQQLRLVLRWPQSVGIVGGRPGHSYYFMGFQVGPTSHTNSGRTRTHGMRKDVPCAADNGQLCTATCEVERSVSAVCSR